MPRYLTHKDNTYYFRQSVPPELRLIVGKREIKKSLGREYTRAVSECKRFAVAADLLISEARARLDSIPVAPYSRQGIRRTRHVPLTRVSPELETEFANLMRTSLLETDRNTRIAGMDAAAFAEYGQHIDASIQALRRQLAMGNVEPMLESARVFLIGCGYNPDFSVEEWRRIAYVMTQATFWFTVRYAGHYTTNTIESVTTISMKGVAGALLPPNTAGSMFLKGLSPQALPATTVHTLFRCSLSPKKMDRPATRLRLLASIPGV